MNQAYRVKLPTFEGPLDLLLHLIQQYEYRHAMQHLELNIASEYLVMASTLLALKSKMLIRNQEVEETEDEYMDDPREELVQRLLEYKKYKEAAQKLKDHEGQTIYIRPPTFINDNMSKQKVKKGELSIDDMLHALGKMLARKEWNKPLDTKIKRTEISVQEQMRNVLQIVKRTDGGIRFDALFDNPSRPRI